MTASRSAPGGWRARLRRPRRRAVRKATTVALLAGAVACALLVWPGFLHGGTAYVIVSGQSMEPALHAGDLVITVRHGTYEVGDVVAYRIPGGQPGAGVLVIHRIVGGSASAGYITQGDNREGRDPWRPRPHDVVGAETVRVPWLGLALAYLRAPLGLAAIAGLVTGLLILGRSTTTGAREGAGGGRSLRARLRRGRGRSVDRLGDLPLRGEEPVAAGASASTPATAAPSALDEAERPVLARALTTLAILVALAVVAQRHL